MIFVDFFLSFKASSVFSFEINLKRRFIKFEAFKKSFQKFFNCPHLGAFSSSVFGQWAAPVSLHFLFACAPRKCRSRWSLKETGFALHIQTLIHHKGVIVFGFIMQLLHCTFKVRSQCICTSCNKLALLAPFRFAQRLIAYMFVLHCAAKRNYFRACKSETYAQSA